MFKKTKLSAGLMLAFGSAILASVPALAQEVQRVEVTGSSIKRLNSEGTAPVQTFTQADIQRSGSTSVTDFLQSLPVMQGFTASADSVGGGGGGITTASIHDVGEQYTLVLLNGRRVAPATSGTTIDLNSIPLSAIERVEVLTDGASALYGADAIAGVVNFILKRGASPLTLDAKVTGTEQGGGGKGTFSISKGFGDLEADGYEVFLSGSFEKYKQLRAKQRDFAKSGIILGGRTPEGLNYDFFNGSSRSVPPNIDVRYNDLSDPVNKPPKPNGNSVTSFSPYLLANGECPADHMAIGRQCFFDYTSTVEISPEQERKGVYASGKVKLGNSGFNAFGDFVYTDVSTIARIAPYPAEFSLDPSHPYFAKYVAPNLTADQLANLTSVNVKYRLYDMGNRTYDYNTKALHTVAGIEGAVAGWDTTAAVTYSGQKQDQNYVSGFPLAAKFQAGIDAQLFDPFLYAVGEMPADQKAALLATGYSGNYNTTDIKMLAADFNAQRPMFKLAGGDAILSVGGDVRKTSYKVTPNSAVANAEILFDDPQPSYDLSRTGFGVYAESSLPVTKTIEGQLAVRYDQMSGVTDSQNNSKFGKTESAGTFKLGAKWRATDNILVRASYGTGFRTASMLEIAQPVVDFGVTSGTYNCPFSASYDPLGYYAAGYTCDDKTQKEVFSGGNPDLKPEKSTQWNIGVVMQPTAEMSIGLNYWSVSVKDAVSSVSEQLILDNPEKYLDLYTTKYKASNGQTYVAILLAPINIGRLENQGLDWDVRYRMNVPIGKLDLSVAGTYLAKSRYTVPGTNDQWTDSLGKFGVNDAVSFRNIVVASGTLSHGAFEHTLTAKYRSGYLDQEYSADDCVFYTDAGDCTAGRLKVPSYSTYDWRTAWNVNKNLKLVFSVENLLNTDPPRSLRVNGAGHQLGYDPRYASPYGRTYGVQGTYKF